MKNTAQESHVLRLLDSDGYQQTVEFTPLNEDRVNVYFSSMGDYNTQSTERAREIYRALVSEGWAA
tara:strand:+ start:414 stop:611 length:198 start_codon:yes stop_codon:yes gene_type:complete